MESRLPIQSITVMVQKEAGQRLCAKMGTRESSAVTAAVNYYAVPKMLFSVSRGSFMPPPNVDSCVIRLDVRKEPPIKVKDEKFLFRVIRGAFSQRRKNIVNSLSSALGDMDISKENISAAAADAGISLSARAEQLTLE